MHHLSPGLQRLPPAGRLTRTLCAGSWTPHEYRRAALTFVLHRLAVHGLRAPSTGLIRLRSGPSCRKLAALAFPSHACSVNPRGPRHRLVSSA